MDIVMVLAVPRFVFFGRCGGCGRGCSRLLSLFSILGLLMISGGVEYRIVLWFSNFASEFVLLLQFLHGGLLFVCVKEETIKK